MLLWERVGGEKNEESRYSWDGREGETGGGQW